MFFPRRSSGSTLLKILFVGACLFGTGTRLIARAAPVAAQEEQGAIAAANESDELIRGIELYRRGDAKGALPLLLAAVKRQQDDARAWHFLGLLYKQQGNLKDALKSFEKALTLHMVKLRPNIPAESLQAYGKLSQEERARHLAQVVADYEAAAETVAAYVSLSPEEADFWRLQLTSLHYYATHIASTTQSERVYSPGDVTTRAQFLQRSYPIYTERARRKQRSGKVVLRVILAFDGTVRHIIPLRRLPDGLTEAAVAAAQATSFTPAIQDDRPVSVWATLEYNFNIY